jgi:hypothetical protein
MKRFKMVLGLIGSVLALAGSATASTSRSLPAQANSPSALTASPTAISPSAPTKCRFGRPEDPQVTEVVGMTLAQASAHEKARGQITRLVDVDGTCQYMRMDLRYDRTDLWVRDGQVVWAITG